jgi:predicted phosphodiesterase
MKIAVIGDTHWGVRNDNRYFYAYQSKFLQDVFFPKLEERGIKRVVHLGDIVDRRKYINFLTLASLKEDFLDPLQAMDIEMDVVCGNHDSYFKDTIAINSLDLLLWPYANINRITKPLSRDNLCFIPWICEDNLEDVKSELEYTDAKVVFGHLELTGYEMMPGHVCEHGHDPKLFEKFHHVFSGHFHKATASGNITYLGTPWQMTWIDYGQRKGFYIFDTESYEIEFIENPHEMFVRHVYNDENMDIDKLGEFDYSQFTDKYVKVVVSKKTNPYCFDLFIERIEQHNPIKLQITEEASLVEVAGEEIETEGVEDTTTILTNYIDRFEGTAVPKDMLKTKLVEIYTTALSYQSG